MEVKQMTARYPDDITRAAHVFTGINSAPHVHLALMADGEVSFPGHLCTPEPAESQFSMDFRDLAGDPPLQHSDY